MTPNLHDLRPGDRLQLRTRATVKVTDRTQDGHWIPVIYITAPGSPELVATRDLCSPEEIERQIF